jgi:acyl-coenzyme A thioesterase PaaI-like protein
MRRGWGDGLPSPHIWVTLGYRSVEQGGGRSVVEWDATPEYCFSSPGGPIVHGGMVTTLLDTAMGASRRHRPEWERLSAANARAAPT